jgi:hypothetical protein
MDRNALVVRWEHAKAGHPEDGLVEGAWWKPNATAPLQGGNWNLRTQDSFKHRDRDRANDVVAISSEAGIRGDGDRHKTITVATTVPTALARAADPERLTII